MEIHEALARCLRALEKEPAQLVALARRLAAQAHRTEESFNLEAPPLRNGLVQGRSNRAVLRSSQAVLSETLSQLRDGNS